MSNYSPTSESRISTATQNLQKVFRFVLARFDHTVLYGHRNKTDQDAAVASGASKAPWPTSKHNAFPSNAVDAAPYYAEVPSGGIDWRTDAALMKAAKEGKWDEVKAILENIKRWHTFGGYVLGAGDALGVPLRWGGDWDLDFRFNDQTLIDLPHFEEKT